MKVFLVLILLFGFVTGVFGMESYYYQMGSQAYGSNSYNPAYGQIFSQGQINIPNYIKYHAYSQSTTSATGTATASGYTKVIKTPNGIRVEAHSSATSSQN